MTKTARSVEEQVRSEGEQCHPEHAVAIVGMAGRFPGARNVEELWSNLTAGVESITEIPEDRLRDAGVPEQDLRDPSYVRATARLDDADRFDAAFFGIQPHEAALIDPQHRIFLECAWEAMESAGYDTSRYPGRVALFGGLAPNTYHKWLLARDPELVLGAGEYPFMVASEKEAAITRTAYKLGLRGPAVNVQTACSTSAVAVHLACRGLLTGECDIALAGGGRVRVPFDEGYHHVEGGPLSPDGHCRAFDASAAGMVRGSGMCFVVLKRLEDAVADRDQIHAVIRGTAVNNDGADRIGYTAPGLRGQTELIEEALTMADVDPVTVGYVEAHGTGTALGDPIEVGALTRAFRKFTDRTGYCRLGSIKTNIGHLDAGAGVAGLIKATLAVREGIIPPSLHFRRANPEIDFERSPFRVATELAEWEGMDGGPRRAAVSSFGLGGTNAHIVLEEPPAAEPPDAEVGYALLPLSARTGRALEAVSERLATHLEAEEAPNLGDAAYTLQVGRRRFERRRIVVCRDSTEAVRLLRTSEAENGGADQGVQDSAPHGVTVLDGTSGAEGSPIVFMFPGVGSQHSGMARDLHARQPVFREAMDRCLEALEPELREELRNRLSGSEDVGASENDPGFEQPSRALPALFAAEYALARLLASWGLEPDAMIGHSLGEYTAACIAEVMTPEDAAALVEFRGELFERISSGVMVSIPLSGDEVRDIAPEGISIAAENLPGRCVAAGTEEVVEALEERLRDDRIEFRRLHIAAAAHSSLLDPHLEEFRQFVDTIELHPPRIPYVSNVTGDWATPDLVATPDYWVRHLRGTVRFSDGLERLLNTPGRPLLEVGPGQVLSTLARMHPKREPEHAVISTMRHPLEKDDDEAVLLGAVGRMWIEGVDIDWGALHGERTRRRVPLPTYPFQGERHWLEPRTGAAPRVAEEPAREKRLTSIPHADGTMAAKQPSSAPSSEGDGNGSAPATNGRALTAVRNVLSELSGIPPEDLHPDRTFIDLGFESLSLTQAGQAFRRDLNVEVSFRDMIETYRTPSALARHLEPQLKEDGEEMEDRERVELASERDGHPDGNTSSKRPTGSAGAIERTSDPHPQRTATPQEGDPAPHGTSKHGPWRPVEADGAGELTEPRREHIEGLVRRLNARTPTSKQRTQEHRRHLADPRSVEGFRRAWKDLVHPIVVEESSGARLRDVDGNEWLDIAMGFGSVLLGHNPPFLREALEAQLRRGFAIGPQTPFAGDVAERICRMTGVERVAFCNTGSEAVLAGIRTARTVTGRNKIVMFSGSYHGIFDEVLARNIHAGGTRRTLPVAPGIPPRAVEDVLVLDYDDPASLQVIREHAHELAVVLVEPVQSRQPGLQPRDFVRELRALTEELDVPLLLDEMITGFRSHPAGIQGLWGIDADILTYGKVVGGGFPIGVVGGRARFMDALDGGWWNYGDDSVPEAGVTWFAGTFVRHPASLAAAGAVLEHLESAGPELQRNLDRRTATFVDEVNDAYGRLGVPIRLARFSSLFVPEFHAQEEWSPLFTHELRARGVHATGTRGGFLSTAHTDEDLELLVAAFRGSAEAMKEGGFYPSAARAQPSRIDNEAAPIEPQPEPARNEPEPTPVQNAEEIVPLTAGQEEVWLATRMGDEASSAFNLPFGVHLRGTLHDEALCGALDHLAGRHESLRAVFLPDGSGQRFLPTSGMKTSVEDLSGLPPEERERRLEALERSEAETPFDLERGPPVRAKLIRLAADEHVLLLTAHHAVCDGWSSGVLLRELGEIYSALAGGRAPRLAPAPRFRSFIHEEEHGRSGPRGKEVEERWVHEFSGNPPAVDLPTDRPRRSDHDFRANARTLDLSEALHTQVREAAKRTGTTSFAYLLAAFEALLYRLTGQEDLVVGVTVAGQPHHGASDLVGHCVSLLPLRARITGEESFTRHAAATRDRLLDALGHRPYSLGTLLKQLRMSRHPGRPPLVAAVFNLDRDPTSLDFAGMDVERRPISLRYTHADIFVNATPLPSGGLRLELRYAAGLFDGETIAAWLNAYRSLLQEAVHDAERPTHRLPVLSEEARAQLEEWTDTAVDLGPPMTAAELLAEAMEGDGRPAVESDSGILDRAELSTAADRVAERLRAEGAGPGDRIAVLVPRSAEMVAALIGVWRAGAAYVPLDPELPEARLEFMLQDSGASLVLTTAELAGVLPDAPALPQLLLDAEKSEHTGADPVETDDPDAATEGSKPRVAGPDDPAYVIYTSGSTGRPKGVEVSHRSLVNFLRSMARKPGLTPDDRLLAVTTLSFDISLLEIFLPLLSGGTTVIADAETAADGRRLLSRLQEGDITVMQATPATWRLLIDAGWDGDPALRSFCGGEALPRDLARELLERSVEVWNLYGPTEATVWCARHRLSDPDEPILIGRPIENTRAYILDGRGERVPVGVVGELWIGGEQVALGYVDRPELTADRFRPDPFADAADARMYRTGDLARWRPDGRLECLGRIDHQIKVRGFRIEPGEVEAEIADMDGVRQAVVGAHDDGRGSHRLVAWVSYEPGRELLGSEVRSHLRDRLPGYMVPSLVAEVPEFPLTSSGKVDRNALPDPLREVAGPEEDFVEPTGPMEEALAEIWRDALGVSRVGAQDNFFDLGGHSLLAMRTLLRIEESTGCRLEPRDMALGTLGQLAATAEERARGAGKGTGT